jgi:hypothetical protein
MIVMRTQNPTRSFSFGTESNASIQQGLIYCVCINKARQDDDDNGITKDRMIDDWMDRENMISDENTT